MSKKAKPPARSRWTPFVEQPMPPAMIAGLGGGPCRWLLNNIYEVHLRPLDAPLRTWLSIKRRDHAPIRDWRDLQRIKNELVGSTVEAVELYPAESRLVDMSNQYHLWCLPPGEHFPSGCRAGG